MKGSVPRLDKRVDDADRVDVSRILHIFRKKNGASGLLGCANDEGVPKGQPVKPVQINGGKDVRNFGGSDIELGQQFDFAPRNAGIHAQFPRDCNEILLQHLQRHHTRSGAAVFGNKLDRSPLFRRGRLVVGVDENVGIEKATSAHESRRG